MGPNKPKGEPKAAKARAKWVAPLAASCVAVIVASLLMMPMLKMDPRDVPVGIISLDQGVTLGDESVNVGDLLMAELTGEEADTSSLPEGLSLFGESEEDASDGSASDGESNSASSDEDVTGYVTSDAVHWMVAQSEQELDEMLSSGQCYATLTIPADFSRSIVANAGRTTLGAQLVEKLPTLSEGANALSDGASSLQGGTEAVESGASKLAGGISTLENGLGALPSTASGAKDGAAALGDGLERLEGGAISLKTGADALQSGAASTQQAVDAALAALTAASPDIDTALKYLQGASQGTAAVESGAATLAEGAATLAEGLGASKSGAEALESGMGKLADSAPALSRGMGALSSGASQLESGTSTLAEGAGGLSDGAAQLAEGLDTANGALDELPAEEGPSAIQLVINQGKNPMVSNSLGSAISSMGASSGIAFDVSYINPLPEGMSMGFTHMILMIFTYISSYATAVVLANVFKLQRGAGRRMLAALGLQVAYAALCALLIGICAAAIVGWATGAAFAFWDLALFVCLASFAFQMLVLGSLDLFGMAGMVVPIGLLVIGMGTAYLPTEFLPAFWQNWVYPWDPLRFMVDGFRGILYMGQGSWNPSSTALVVLAVIGAVLMALKLALSGGFGSRLRGPKQS